MSRFSPRDPVAGTRNLLYLLDWGLEQLSFQWKMSQVNL